MMISTISALFSKYVAVGTIVSAIAAGGYIWHVTNQRNAALERIGKVETQLSQALEVNRENEAAVDMLQNTIRAQAAELRTLADSYSSANVQLRRMQATLRNIRLEDLAAQNPQLLQDEINRRTAEFIEELNRETRDFSTD